ncbi:ABC transporter ATP-binding protein [Galbitalea sp. SE-J8]|uniref:ABC transporter ATP-binding protein n=1 Tax=Galbitalea sp. SE-J8 TaxID=3054952 RepID=UPI00259CED98|nr:ABC transporter ATP-binding protein [Galbitalea sp. SE-J8]MDM4764170.1 ABC transporter ATP-binding protein [Galbitalea sp. SE-J8]
MNAAIEVRDLTKRFGAVTAVDAVSFSIRENAITGLLGRNGAGKTTLMQLLTGQQFATSGSILVGGAEPAENAAALERMCFVREAQRYPEDFRVQHVLRSARWFFPEWDAAFAQTLVTDFRLPLTRRVKKLSRGQLSAVGIVVGLASRAPITFFDEPYLGLDAVARQIFYDRLLADYAEHPRTVVLSTHLIDEVGALLERAIVIDDGRVLLDDDVDALRGTLTTVTGGVAAVDAFVGGRRVLHRQSVGSFASVTVGGLDDAARADAVRAGLELAPVSLQQLVVRTTTSAADPSASTGTEELE